jgi:sirohydrochlorin ferrochelatase
LDAIVLFSHGSVLCGSERNLFELAEALRRRGDAPIVEVGFLNYSEPLFAAAVKTCVDRGATRVVIAPYFLVSGKFVVKDLPGAIEQVRATHPDVEFATADVIGFHPALADAILASAAAARPPEEWHEALHQTTGSCRENPSCPLYGTQFCRVSAEALT